MRIALVLVAALLSFAVRSGGAALASEPRSLVGVNTDRLEFFSPACPTIDAVKTSQRWGSPKNPGDQTAPVDADGWPAGDFGVVVHADVPGVAGVYKLSCDGKADVAGTWGQTVVRNQRFDGKRTTADVEHKGVGAFALAFTNTDGGVRNLKLLRPGYKSDAGVFTREYIKSKEPFGAVRLMNWTLTNNSKIARWDDRCKPADAQWSIKGGPWEPWLDYAAAQGKDLWLCVPHLADDEYVRHLAQLCKDRLKDAPVALYLENSNEYWNWQFGQAKWTDERAKQAAGELKLDAPSVDAGNLRHRYHADRTVRIGQIFREVFGRDDPRVRPVLTGQFANPPATEDAVRWIGVRHGPPKDFIYGVASAPYFGNWGDVHRVDCKTQDVAAHMLAAARACGEPGNPMGKALQQFAATAERWGVRNMAYEGGADLGAAPHTVSKGQLPGFIQVRANAQNTPQAGQAVDAYFNWWFKAGGQEFFYYKDFSMYNKSGYFGLSNHPGKIDTPKYQAATKAAKAHPAPALKKRIEDRR